MKAVRVHAYGPPGQLILEDVPDVAPGPGEVVVAVAAAGVNPADYKFRSGALAKVAPRSLPYVPGIDVAGRIIAVGDGVEGWHRGDRVVAMLHHMTTGGYAEQVTVPTAFCAPIPDGLNERMAAALPTPGVTAIEWIEDDLLVQYGDRLLVTGASGSVGRVACFTARQLGAHVTAMVRPAQVEQVLHADAVLTVDEAAALPDGGFDGIADTIGGKTARRLLRTLKPGGVLSTVATDPVGNPDGLDVTVRFFGNHPDAARLGALARAVAEGRLQIAAPRVLRLSEAARAHELMEAGGAGKIVLVPDAMF